MSFIWPIMLVLLIAAPLLLALFLYMQNRRRRRIAAGFGNPGWMKSPAGQRAGIRRYLPLALFLAGLTTLIVALARPQAVVSLPKVEGTVMLVFDVSGSMMADDLKPTRLEASKTAAQGFIESQPAGIQIGVVSFSDTGFSIQKPTSDKEAVLAAINRLAPARSTSLGSGILVALNTIAAEIAGEEPSFYSLRTPQPSPTPTPVAQGVVTSAVIVLLTDGENTSPPDPLDAARVAAESGVRIHTVGIGSPAGTTLNVNGFTVHTQLDEATLRQIAQLTGGDYFNADDEEKLRDIYDSLEPELVIKPERMEVTSLFAGAGILIFLTGAVLSLLWNGRFP